MMFQTCYDGVLSAHAIGVYVYIETETQNNWRPPYILQQK